MFGAVMVVLMVSRNGLQKRGGGDDDDTRVVAKVHTHEHTKLLPDFPLKNGISISRAASKRVQSVFVRISSRAPEKTGTDDQRQRRAKFLPPGSFRNGCVAALQINTVPIIVRVN